MACRKQVKKRRLKVELDSKNKKKEKPAKDKKEVVTSKK